MNVRRYAVVAALALAAMVAAPDLGMAQAKENASKDESRNAALLLHNPTNFRTDRWESDGSGAAEVSIKSGSVSISGPVTTVTTGGDKISTETTLAAVLAKLLAAPSTEAKQDSAITELQSILAKIIAAPATEAKQDTGNTSLASLDGKDFATQTTLAAILAKIIAAPATEAKQDTGNTSLASIDGKDFATQTTLAAILAKILAAPATETKQDTGNTSLNRLDAGVTNVLSDTTAILAKIIAAPATEAKQDTGNSSLSSIDGKIPASPSQDRTTAAAPSATRLSDGTSFYKATTPSDVQTTNMSQVGGTATSTGSGTADAGTLRVVLPTDQSAVPVTSGRPTEEVKFASVTITGTGTTAIISAVPAKKIRILAVLSAFTSSAGSPNVDGLLHFGTRTTTSEFFPFTYGDFGGDAEHWNNDSAPEDATANQAVNITVDTIAGTSPRLRFTIQYREVD